MTAALQNPEMHNRLLVELLIKCSDKAEPG